MTSVAAGIGWHMLGAAMAATFYVPLERARRWSWETTWTIAGVFSWLLAPVAVSLLLLPDFRGFYASLDSGMMLRVVLFGMLWGVGSITYGLTVRHLGLSLGIGMAIGLTLMVGTLLPPLVAGEAAQLFLTRSGLINLAGVAVALLGVATVSWAGHQKEVQLKGHLQEFNLALGFGVAVLCGITSSGMSFGIAAAKPMQAAALALGVNPLYAALPAYVLIMGGGSVVNFAYCAFQLARKPGISLRADLSQPAPTMLRNLALAAVGGLMWYLQFFFYAWGAANIAERLSYVNWMLHMSLYVLCGSVVGLGLGEWRGVRRRALIQLLTGIAIIIAAANLVGLGMAAQ